jgi:uncharacterized membrane protein YfcA
MWLWLLATTVAFFIKGLCGFANTLIFTSILGFGTNNVNISPVEIVLGYPTNIIMIWKNRKELSPKVYIPLAILVLAGSIPGAFLLKNVNAQYIKIVFGIVVILIALEMLFRERGKINFKESRLILGSIGILSGVLCGLFGVGALLAAYVSRVTETSDGFKANICAVFVVENTFRIILYSVIGVLTLSNLKQSLIMIPFMLIGLFAGIKVVNF